MLEPRTPANLDSSLHANYGYNESTKRAEALAQSQMNPGPATPTTPQQKQPTAKTSAPQRQAPQPGPAPATMGLRPGPVGPGGPGGPALQHTNSQGPKGAPLPNLRPAMPAPLPSTGSQPPGGMGGGLTTFNPAEVVQQKQQPMQPPTIGPPAHAPPRGG